MSTLSLITLLFFSVAASAAVSDSLVICKHDKLVRTLRISKENGRCQTVYTKDGKDQIIGSGLNPASCVKYLEHVRENLSQSNWKCRDAKGSAVSDLHESGNKE